MKISRIQIPPNSIMVYRYDWQMEYLRKYYLIITKGDWVDEDLVGCACEFLNLLIHHSDYKSANEIWDYYVKRPQNYNKDKKFRLVDVGDWLPYTIQNIAKSLCYAKDDVMLENRIIESIKFLKEIYLINDEVPQDIKENYASKLYWIKADIDKIQAMSDSEVYEVGNDMPPEKVNIEGIEVPTDELNTLTILDDLKQKPTIRRRLKEAVIKPPKHKEIEISLESMALEKKIILLCNFHQHIQNMRKSYVYGDTARYFIKTMLTGYKSGLTGNKMGVRLSQIAQAIIGNAKSDFHQNKSPKNTSGKRFNDFAFIIGDDEKLNRSIENAEKAGVSEAEALFELKVMLSGGISKHSLLMERDMNIRKKQGEKLLYETGLPPNILRQYRELGHDIGVFFKSENVQISDVMEFVKSNKKGMETYKDFIEVEVLAEAVRSSVKLYVNPIPDTIEQKITQFARNFCRLNELNKGR